MKSDDVAIKVVNLNKIYRVGVKDKTHDNMFATLLEFIKSPINNYNKYRSLYNFDDLISSETDSDITQDDIVWSVKDVSFELKKGGVLGLIGGNGAGKSTLLKLLARITEPTSGRIEIHGRISSLLEVGTGFHPELTGRENVYLNGIILGMRKTEVERKFNQIVEFSGVGKFLDTPVKRYSSGMRVRLAFSVAAFMEPEILLVDEVLAVGDATFQKQCLGKMSEVSQQGRTIIFVSHNMAAIEHLCDRVIVLEKGKMILDAEPRRAIAEYFESISSNSQMKDLTKIPRKKGFVPVIQKVEFLGENGNAVSSVPSGDTLTVRIHFKHSDVLPNPHFGLAFETNVGVKIFWVQTKLQVGPLPQLSASGIIECKIPRLPLLAGTYYVTPGCGSQSQQLDHIERGVQLEVTESDVFGTGKIPKPSVAMVFVDADWHVVEGLN